MKYLSQRLHIKGSALYEAAECRPTDPASVIVHDAKTGENEFRDMRWGLVPSWAKDLKIRTQLLNARSETLAEKPAFREAFRSRRCVIPVGSFYEFDKTSRYLVTPVDGKTMAVAGLWEARKWDGDELVTFTMVTTDPNEVIAKVHDRMPAILSDSDLDAWLDPALTDAEALSEMLSPVPAEALRMEYDGPRASVRRLQQTLFS